MVARHIDHSLIAVRHFLAATIQPGGDDYHPAPPLVGIRPKKCPKMKSSNMEEASATLWFSCYNPHQKKKRARGPPTQKIGELLRFKDARPPARLPALISSITDC